MERNNVLVVSAHPDDETFGCGGTILKHRAMGDHVSWLIITDALDEQRWGAEFIKNRQDEIKVVTERYGFDSCIKLGFPTMELDTIPVGELVSKTGSVISELKSNIIYVVNRSDIHTDHQIVFQAVYSCTKSFRYPHVKRVMMYECLSETEFTAALPGNVFMPNVFVDITPYFNEKREIVRIYKSELMNRNQPRSVEIMEALARYRGSRIGVEYGEAFQLVFDIM
ncbi:MAG: PIG-L family deacetylase [Bacteroidales bacterium]|jgi:LmbE family N-acetylglucosaminyl deacetylase|nr:PIG-L family deacetylase [Bacteroidales bacterium]